MTRPLVSAIVPTFRRPRALARSLGSIVRQSWRPLELIVVDDGSGDETPRVLDEFAPVAAEAEVSFVHFEVANGGPGMARNAAMARASGEYFAFLDDDDEWLPEKLERQLAVMEASPDAGVSFTQFHHSSDLTLAKPPADRMTEGWVFDSLCTGTTRAHMQTVMIRRAVFEEIGGFAPLYNFEDMQYLLRASLGFTFVSLIAPMTVIRTEDATVSRAEGLEGDLKRDELKLRVLNEFAKEYRTHPRYSEGSLKVLLGRIYDEHIKHLLWLGRVGEARKAYQTAIGDCGELPRLKRLRRKLFKARIAGMFGKTLRKP